MSSLILIVLQFRVWLYFCLGVIAFITGAPDYEDGQLDTKRYGEQYASKGEDVELMLLPEQIPSYRDLAYDVLGLYHRLGRTLFSPASVSTITAYFPSEF
ncbi:unnamed protein product [Triticum turgidum subsp. durum]|uniref:Uncharacterized protein n=1 Tax=Triticum turgidum subsp. durum TaxID=4567 RepID=A0A9R0ZIZ0_TRITD|nr:unnamed protein product [Triticum turgidum subsp. durum]